MSKDARSLLALTVYHTFAPTLFGFGTLVYSFRTAYEKLGREPLIQTTSWFTEVSPDPGLQGGWRGVLAALFIVVGATAIIVVALPALPRSGRRRSPGELR